MVGVGGRLGGFKWAIGWNPKGESVFGDPRLASLKAIGKPGELPPIGRLWGVAMTPEGAALP